LESEYIALVLMAWFVLIAILGLLYGILTGFKQDLAAGSAISAIGLFIAIFIAAWAQFEYGFIPILHAIGNRLGT